MQELIQQNSWIFTAILVVLAIMLIAFLIRAIIGLESQTDLLQSI